MRNCTILLALLAALVALAVQPAHAAITWNLTGGGNWDTVTHNWTGDSTTFTDDGTVDVIFNKTNGGTITISPNMSPNSTTVSADSGTYTFQGGPIDSGSLTKSGGGNSFLYLLGNNTYSGTTTYSGGRLYVGNNTTTGSLGTGEVILENSVSLAFRRSDDITVDNLISGNGHVYQLYGNVSLANNANSFSGWVHAQNGTISIASIADVGTSSALGSGNTIYLGGDYATGTLKYTGGGHSSNRGLYLWGGANAGGGTVDASGTGPLNLTSTAAIDISGWAEWGASGRLLTLTGSNTGDNTLAAIIPDLDTDGSIYGWGPALTALTKSGAGKWILSGANTFSDVTDITAGVLNIRNDDALGSHGNNYADMTYVRSGAALQLQGGISVGATGANGETTFLYGTGVANDGAIRNISGDNTYNGWINLKSAATRINSDSGTLYLPGNNNSPISGNMGATNLSLTFGGAGNINVAARIHAYSDGILTLIKDGAGTLTLSGTNDYTGTTDVNQGTLLVTGTHTGGAAYTVAGGGATLEVDLGGVLTIPSEGVSVESGGTLDVDGSLTATGGVSVANGVLTGDGAIYADVAVDWHLRPGSSIGTLDIDGNLALNAGSRYDWEVGASTFDLVAVNGELDLTGSWGLRIINAGGSGAPGDYRLFTYTVDLGLGQPWYDAAGLAAMGWTEDMLSVIDKGSGTGPDDGVFLHVIPEPNTLVLLVGGLLALLLFAWRRKR